MDGYFAIIFLLAIVCFFVSLVVPAAFRNIPYLKTLGSRKKLATFFGLVAIFSFILFGVTTESTEEQSLVESTDISSASVVADIQVEKQISEKVYSDAIEIASEGLSEHFIEVKEGVTDEELSVSQEVMTDDQEINELLVPQTIFYPVDRVVDGDTVDVVIDGKIERLRLIGIDTPETVHPSKPVECFGVEASNKAKELLSGQRVELEVDDSQGDRDKYGRLLRYVFLEDGTNFNELMIAQGYAYEYTYDGAYKYQSLFKNAQQSAKQSGRGLWGAVCETHQEDVVLAPVAATSDQDNDSCVVKGNISSSDEKIYHVPGCDSYNQTRISEAKGEAWFCTEQEAVSAGWRKALNCN
jgi:endonuclease YncB( thermonuclease family)